MADIVNDFSLVLELLTPLFTSPTGELTTWRVGVLCLIGLFRALCGVTAGGSKAAITMHFADVPGGNIGDLSAKDGSKETVLSLAGILVRIP